MNNSNFEFLDYIIVVSTLIVLIGIFQYCEWRIFKNVDNKEDSPWWD